jgi:hypothetical protein
MLDRNCETGVEGVEGSKILSLTVVYPNGLLSQNITMIHRESMKTSETTRERSFSAISIGLGNHTLMSHPVRMTMVICRSIT